MTHTLCALCQQETPGQCVGQTQKARCCRCGHVVPWGVSIRTPDTFDCEHSC